jgi:xanthine dehydrogenase YagS FAD-binding subunit
VVNLKTVPGLSYIKEEDGLLKIGALTKLTAIAASAVVQKGYAAVAQAARLVAAPEVRNMGTIGGNISQHVHCEYYHNDYNTFPCRRKVSGGPCYALTGYNRKHHSVFGALDGCVATCPSDLAPVLVALGAAIVTSKRTVAAADFFTARTSPGGEGINILDRDEIITEIRVPALADGARSTYVKFAFRKAIDFPLVSVAAVSNLTGGVAGATALVLGGVYNTPRRAAASEGMINGKAIDTASAAKAGDTAAQGASPLPMNLYKVQLVKVMVKRALLALAA